MAPSGFFLFAALCAVQQIATVAKGLEQIEHVIIFMQENRPFDHYFGTLKGVRGFNDRTAHMMRSGMDSFHQPIDQADLSQYMLPFHTEANETNAMCMPAPCMDYTCNMKVWNSGRYDSWNTGRDPGYGMAHFTRADLPFYYALYDHYAIGDQYFQSTFTSTNPNRLHLFSGSNGLSVGQEAILDNREPKPGFTWTTLAEMLEAQGVSWKVYQQLDNFDDNAYAWFANFHNSRPGDALFDKGMARQLSLMKAFNDDLTGGTLPQVSIVIAPTRKSEHATNHPCAGEDFTARLLKILWAHPETYAKSLFILNYDEGGQFYDHHWSPTPPVDESAGYSSVTVEGEVNRYVATEVPAPMGLGYRVPLLMISPWTRGHIVNSQVFDHTSVIQLLEKRFGFTNTNISPWRRLVSGDMTSFFDFDHPDYSIPSNLPDTSKYVELGDVECHTLPDPIIPKEQKMPMQEQGTRISRALPYELQVTGGTEGTVNFNIIVKNTGRIGAAFTVFDLVNLETVHPKQYALAAGDETIAKAPIGAYYGFALHGTNGFLREFRGSAEGVDQDGIVCGNLNADLSYNPENSEIIVTLYNKDPVKAAEFFILDNAYGSFDFTISAVPPASTGTVTFSTAASGNWYDVTVKTNAAMYLDDDKCMKRRFMGRMETGKDGISDPAMDRNLPNWLPARTDAVPPLPDHVRVVKRVETPSAEYNKDARFYPKEREQQEEL